MCIGCHQTIIYMEWFIFRILQKDMQEEALKILEKFRLELLTTGAYNEIWFSQLESDDSIVCILGFNKESAQLKEQRYKNNIILKMKRRLTETDILLLLNQEN